MPGRAPARTAAAALASERKTEGAVTSSKLRLLGVVLLCLKVALVPLVFDPGLDMPFPVPKALLSHSLGYLLAAVLSGLLIRFGRSALSWSWLHVSVIAFLAVSALAAVFAADRTLALFGTHARMLGLGTVADDVILYFAVALLVRTRKEAVVLVASGFGVAVVVLGYELIQVAGRDPFRWAFDTALSPLSTIGQPTTLAHYLTVVAVGSFVVGLLATELRRTMRIGLFLYAAALFVGSVATGTRSTVLGVATGGAFLLLLILFRRMSPRVRTIALVGASAASIGLAVTVAVSPIGARLVSTIQPASGDESVDTAVAELDPSTENRLTIYRIALQMVTERPLLGYGPDNFVVGVPEYRPAEINPQLRRGVFSSAHSWVAHVASGSGLVGLVTFLAVLGIAAGQALRPAVPLLGQAAGAMLSAFLGAGVTTVNDITTDVLLWAILGAIAAATTWNIRIGRAGGPAASPRRRPRNSPSSGTRGWLAFACLAPGLVLFASGFSALNASRLAHQSENSRLIRKLPEAIDLGLQATRLDPGRGEYWHKLGLAYAGAARWRDASISFARAGMLAPYDIRYQSDEITAELVLASAGDDVARRRALELADQVVRTDPNNPSAHLTRATTMQTTGNRGEAARSIDRALALDPESTSLRLYISATQIYLDAGRPADAVKIAREGRAILGVTTTAALGFELARALLANGQPREALSEIDLVLSLQPTYPAAERLRTQIRAALGT